MGEPSPLAIYLAIFAGALLLYAFIWYATRSLPRMAQILARLAPLALVVPIMFYLSVLGARVPEFAASSPPSSEAMKPGGATRGPAATEQAPQVTELPPAPRSLPRTGGAPPSPPAAQPPPAEPPAPPAGLPSPPPAAAAPPAASTPPAKEDGARSAAPAPGAVSAPEAGWDVVPVFYGTDRVRKDEPKRISYTTARAHRLELGHALVTVPRSHQVPNIERPFAIRIPYFQVTVYEQAEDPKKHFTIKELKTLTREQFLAMARERIGASSAFKDQAVVFVHGYNTAFDYALFRTAQMAYDLKFDGASFLYSWPSGGGFLGYGYDRESATQAQSYLKDFLALVLQETGAKSVSVIAHSMGNLPLLNVLRELGPALPPSVKLNEVILAAPDVDRDVFIGLAANIKQYSRGVTLYCSANDLAMEAARRVAGGIPRAGDVPPEGPILLAGIDTIDITQTSTDYLALNHSTYAEKGALLNDIGLLLQTGERPPDRREPILQRVSTPKGDFWRFPALR
jgi:esterase/lipase superfamily enzyme